MRTMRVSDTIDDVRPTLATWLKPPGNRWAFRHVRELIPTARVAARSGRPLDHAPVDGLLTDALVDYLTRSFSDALVVLHDGRVALEWYAPGVTADDRHIVFSVTKSITALVAGALAAGGVLDRDAEVASYVPESAGGGYGDARVRDLLDMTADVQFVEDYDGPDMRRYREVNGMLPPVDDAGIHAFLAAMPPAGPHGTRFRYLSPTTDMLAWVCERAAGASLAELIAQHVWGPMGAEADGDLMLDRYGASRAGGGLCATARDTARVGQLLLDDTAQAAVADVFRPGDPGHWAAGDLAEFLPGATYRACWYQPAGDPEVRLAAGIHGQRIYVDAPRRVVIAQQASLPTSYDEQTWLETLPVFRDLARAAGGG
jgi:CubicO group peptidase (beta-lactamase class C family)